MQTKNEHTVTIYSTPTCHFCHMAKEFFKENNVIYNDKDVSLDQAALKEMVDKTDQFGVPVIDIDGSIVVGFDKKKLAELLDIG